MWTCWSIYSFKKLWENIPPHVNMCITGAVCVTHRDRRGLLCYQARGQGTAGCQEEESSSRVARPVWPHGAGWGAGPLAGQAASRQGPAVSCSLGLTVGSSCHSEVPWSVREVSEQGEKGFSCTWAPQLVTPYSGTWVSFKGGSHPIPLMEDHGPAGEAERSTTLSLEEVGFMGKRVAVFQSRVSLWLGLAPGESQEEPRLVFEHTWWVTTTTSSMRARTHARTYSDTHTQMKETDDLDYILCYLVDYKSVKPSLYIDLQYI